MNQICGVVSERTKRLCTRSVNCPQHTEDQRKEIRGRLMTSSTKSSSSLLTKRRTSLQSNDDDDFPGGSLPVLMFVVEVKACEQHVTDM